MRAPLCKKKKSFQRVSLIRDPSSYTWEYGSDVEADIRRLRQMAKISTASYAKHYNIAKELREEEEEEKEEKQQEEKQEEEEEEEKRWVGEDGDDDKAHDPGLADPRRVEMERQGQLSLLQKMFPGDCVDGSDGDNGGDDDKDGEGDNDDDDDDDDDEDKGSDRDNGNGDAQLKTDSQVESAYPRPPNLCHHPNRDCRMRGRTPGRRRR